MEGMLETLLPLHEMMRQQGPSTLQEIAFVQVFFLVHAGKATR